MAGWRTGRSMQNVLSYLWSFSTVKSGPAYVTDSAAFCPVMVYSPTAAFGLSEDTAWGKAVRDRGAGKAPPPFVDRDGRRPAFFSVQDPVGDSLCNSLPGERGMQGWIGRVSPQRFPLN